MPLPHALPTRSAPQQLQPLPAAAHPRRSLQHKNRFQVPQCFGAPQDHVHIHRRVVLQQLHVGRKVALRTRMKMQAGAWGLDEANQPLSFVGWGGGRQVKLASLGSGIRTTSICVPHLVLTASSSSRTCSSMAAQRRSRQSWRPAGSDSRLSQRRKASGKENSWAQEPCQ